MLTAVLFLVPPVALALAAVRWGVDSRQPGERWYPGH
jgi:hypothetical protein